MSKDTFHFKDIEKQHWNERLNTAYSNYKRAMRKQYINEGMSSQDACMKVRAEIVRDTVTVNVFRQGISIDMSNTKFAEMKDFIKYMETKYVECETD